MGLDEKIRPESVGLNGNQNPLGGLGAITGLLNMFGSLGDASSKIAAEKPQEINMMDYFEANRLKDRELKDDDMLTVSIKEDSGYRAVFVRLGDLKKYITGNENRQF